MLAINTSGDEITQVVTDAGSIRTNVVICAAGPWSRSCGGLVGVDLPVVRPRRQVLFTEPIEGLPTQLPMTIDFESTFYFHRGSDAWRAYIRRTHQHDQLLRRAATGAGRGIRVSYSPAAAAITSRVTGSHE